MLCAKDEAGPGQIRRVIAVRRVLFALDSTPCPRQYLSKTLRHNGFASWRASKIEPWDHKAWIAASYRRGRSFHALPS